MVEAETKKGVHEVIFAGDGVKMFQDIFYLLICGHLAVSEISNFFVWSSERVRVVVHKFGERVSEGF